MAEWYDQHVVKHNTIELNKWEKKYLTIQKVLGSEIMLNSSFFGIRGKVDGLLEGEYFDQKQNKRYPVCVPFQLKTGKKIKELHKKSLDIYTLLAR